MKILCLLVTCLNPTNQMSNQNNVRQQQYIEGISKFFEYKDILSNHNVDVCLTDNTCNELPLHIKSLMSNNTIIRINTDNHGFRNKGIGLIYQWKSCEDIISQYDYIIHFEPRQLLINFNFINSFLANPRNLFTLNPGSKRFNTGIFAIQVNQFLQYCNTENINRYVRLNRCIEDDLFYFMKNNNMEFDTEEIMNLYWLNGDLKISC